MIREIEQKPIRYEDYYVARVVRENKNKKVVVAEHRFDMSPTEQDIVEILIHIPSDVADEYFISVEHNYRMVK